MTLEDVPDTRRCQVDTQDGKLAVDPAIAPCRVLPGQAHHQLHSSCGDLRATGGLRVGPHATDQLTMPTEQGIGLHEEPMELPSGDQPAEAGKECSIRGPQGRAVHLATEDRHLVTEHDDFDGQIGLVGSSPAEEFDGPEEGEIEKREGHGPCSRSHPLRRKSQLNGSDEILGTHKVIFVHLRRFSGPPAILWGGCLEPRVRKSVLTHAPSPGRRSGHTVTVNGRIMSLSSCSTMWQWCT